MSRYIGSSGVRREASKPTGAAELVVGLGEDHEVRGRERRGGALIQKGAEQLQRDLVVCVDYSGGRVKAYGLAAAREGDLARLAALLPLFPHYSEIKARLSKRRALELLPRRLARARPYLVELTVSKDLDTVLSALRQLRPRVREAYADIHVLKAVKGALPGVPVRTEDKRRLRSGRPGVLALFNIVDLATNYYKKHGRSPLSSKAP